MKKQLYRIVTGILAVAWMCLIFSFSNQPATESSKVSGGLCHRLVERANDTLHLDMTEKQQLAMAEKIEYPVRKAAHMTEYAILGLLSFAFYRGILKKEKRQFLAALLTAAVYAATDEFHQYFIPGRSAEVMDVCIDTLGASIGLAILFFTLKVVRNIPGINCLQSGNQHILSLILKLHQIKIRKIPLDLRFKDPRHPGHGFRGGCKLICLLIPSLHQ